MIDNLNNKLNNIVSLKDNLIGEFYIRQPLENNKIKKTL